MNFLAENETAADKAETEKIADLFRIFGIILVAFHKLLPVTLIWFSRRLKTEIQYLPVDSIKTSKQELLRSHCLK